jgi:hypothetical protein
MNHDRFDRLSQTLGDTTLQSRRGILATLGIAVLGALAGVDSDAASAKGKSRRHTKGKKHHASKPRHKDTPGRLRASSSKRQRKPEPDSRCAFSRAGDPCQQAACVDETTLQPACSCEEQGQCICPTAVACPNHLVCLKEKGVCLTECRDDFDCATGATCEADGRCTVPPSGLSCDCANLNYCNRNGSCMSDCTCVCDDGWTGAGCETPAYVPTCSDFVTCGECTAHYELGCIFCSATADGATGVCVQSDQCVISQDRC